MCTARIKIWQVWYLSTLPPISLLGWVSMVLWYVSGYQYCIHKHAPAISNESTDVQVGKKNSHWSLSRVDPEISKGHRCFRLKFRGARYTLTTPRHQVMFLDNTPALANLAAKHVRFPNSRQKEKKWWSERRAPALASLLNLNTCACSNWMNSYVVLVS